MGKLVDSDLEMRTKNITYNSKLLQLNMAYFTDISCFKKWQSWVSFYNYTLYTGRRSVEIMYSVYFNTFHKYTNLYIYKLSLARRTSH